MKVPALRSGTCNAEPATIDDHLGPTIITIDVTMMAIWTRVLVAQATRLAGFSKICGNSGGLLLHIRMAIC